MLPREGSVPWRSRHRFKMAARDGVTEKRISEQRPQGRHQTRANRRTLQAGACQHRGPSLSEGFGGCSRKPTWQELREGLESRKKGRRRPGATGALTALGALFPRKQEEGHITADVDRESGHLRPPESLRVTGSRTPAGHSTLCSSPAQEFRRSSLVPTLWD